MSPRSRIAAGALVALATAASCGGGQTRIGPVFSPTWEDDGGKSISRVQARLANEAVPSGADVAVGVTAEGLVGVGIGPGAPATAWSYAHAVDARPAVAGTVVVGTGGGEVFALDAATGKPLWTRKAAGKIRGAGDDGQTTVVSIAPAGAAGALVLAVARDGAVRREIEVEPAVGIPAVVGGMAFLPWQNQYVSVLDVSGGDEVGRVLFREAVTRAFTSGNKLYFGEVGLFRFDGHIGEASRRKATHVALPVRELPGAPRWFTPGHTPLPAAADAPDKIRLYARPSGDGDLGIDSGRFAATYFRIVFGLDAKSGQLAWVRAVDADVLGGAALPGGVALCDAAGKVSIYDIRTGAPAGSASLGKAVRSCVVQAEAARPGGATAEARQLAQQIAEVVRKNEPDMVMAQRFLLREMANLEDESVTRALVDLASDARTPPMLLGDARTALAARRNGAGYMIDALGRRYDFLRDVLRPPPVGPIADALAAMKERRGAGPLAAHLHDPADTSDDVKRAAAALAVLADKPELPALRAFFAMYRASAPDDDTVAATASVGQALVGMGGPEGKAAVTQAIADPLTLPAVKERLEAVLQGGAAAAPAAGTGQDAGAPAGASGPGKGTGKGAGGGKK